jgi:hypothetical protein
MNIESLPARHWEQKATEALDKATTMTSPDARRLMRDVARCYRQMAAIASKRKLNKATGVSPHATALTQAADPGSRQLVSAT